MKAYLKVDPSRIGTVANVYVTDFGQKRLTVDFGTDEGDIFSTIDADIIEFEVVE